MNEFQLLKIERAEHVFYMVLIDACGKLKFELRSKNATKTVTVTVTAVRYEISVDKKEKQQRRKMGERTRKLDRANNFLVTIWFFGEHGKPNR